MPLSPLIRPMSPLQTQSAPPLPAPFNLADVILCPPTANPEDFGAAAPTQPPLSQRRTAPMPSSMDGAPEAAVREHLVQRGVFERREAGLPFTSPRSSSRRSFESRDHAQNASVSAHPVDTATPLACTERRAPATTTSQPSTSSTAPVNFAAHYYGATQNPTTQVKTTSGLSSSPSLAMRRSPQKRSEADSATSLLRTLTRDVAAAAAQPSYGAELLRKSSPDQRAHAHALHVQSTPVRIPSPSPYSVTSAKAKLTTPNGHIDAAPAFITTTTTSAAVNGTTGRLRDVCPTRDEDDLLVLASIGVHAEQAPNRYQGTAVSSRTGRAYTIAIEASLLDGDRAEHTAASTTGGRQDTHAGPRNISSSALRHTSHRHSFLSSSSSNSSSDDKAGKEKQGGGAMKTSTSPDCARRVHVDCACSKPSPTPAKRCVHELGETCNSHHTPRTHSSRSTSPASYERGSPLRSSPTPPPSAAATAQHGRKHAGLPHRDPTRYVYPALDDCQRLLREIQRDNPLLHRCLTPPRPLQHHDTTHTVANPPLFAVFSATTAAAPAGAATSTNHLSAPDQAHEPASVHERPTSAAHDATPASAFAAPQRNAADAKMSPPPPPSLLRRSSPSRAYGGSAASDARRLYSWDARTAAEDLSYMHGPFVQPTEKFAVSTARQLQRLRETGRRLYGTDATGTSAPTPAESTSATSTTRHLSGDLSPASSRGVHVEVRRRRGEETRAAESPSDRLRRLLRETEAAFPVLWRATYTSPSPSPSRSDAREEEATHSRSSAAAAFITLSPSTIQASHVGREGGYDRSDKTASSNAERSDAPQNCLRDSSSLSYDALSLRLGLASLTPARPPPPPLPSRVPATL